jgi:hypothetical protein
MVTRVPGDVARCRGGQAATGGSVRNETFARVWAGQASCADGVRGCPRRSAGGSPRARTYGGRRRRGKADPIAFMQADGHVAHYEGAVCKTVGSAYVGSNPTPATTCKNGPLAANFRASGPFRLCPSVCRLVALLVAVSRCPRTHSGRDSCPGTVGAHRRLFHGRPRTGRASGVFGGISGVSRPKTKGPLACQRAKPPRASSRHGLMMTGPAALAAEGGAAR